MFVACSASTVPQDEPLPADHRVCGRTFQISSRFTDEERRMIDRGIERWNVLTFERLCVAPLAPELDKPETERRVFPVVYYSDEWAKLSDAFNGMNIIGAHFGATDEIALVTGIDDEVFETTILHELGHAHGLGHVPPPAIMYADAGTAWDFTENDLSECRRVKACPAKATTPAADPK
jgi:hypothetical protein